jgi:hypothetical protein
MGRRKAAAAVERDHKRDEEDEDAGSSSRDTGGTGREKRKRKTETRDRHGGRRANVPPGKPGRIEVSDLEIASDCQLIQETDEKAREERNGDQPGLGANPKKKSNNQKGIDPDESSQKGVDADERSQKGGDTDEGSDPSLYFVGCHWDWSTSCKPYSVYKMDFAPPEASSRSSRGRKRLHRLRSLETEAGGKIFTSVRSRHRAWIVGVGGKNRDTVIFDTKTNDVIYGPKLNSEKWCPVLMTVGDRVYAMAKMPSWTFDPDFPPWFEVLDLSKSRVTTDGDRSYLEDCCWSEVPIPACLPWKLHPVQYTILPFVKLWSYAVVGHYIVVSFNHDWGTHALDTGLHKWHKVHDNRLPFIGCAVRHGCIFLASSKEDGPLNAYSICIMPSGKDNALKLSINVLPVKYDEHEARALPCCVPLDKEHFCSVRVSLDSLSVTLNKDNELYPKKALVNLTTYRIENNLVQEASNEALQAVKKTIAVSSHWEQCLKISSSHGFSPFAFSLLSV